MTNDNSFKMPLYSTIELALAMAENNGNFTDLDKIESDDVNIVHNTDAQIALVLPYYSSLDNIASSAALADEDLNNAAGGFGFTSPVTDIDRHLSLFRGFGGGSDSPMADLFAGIIEDLEEQREYWVGRGY